jgi:hypothetical protein
MLNRLCFGEEVKEVGYGIETGRIWSSKNQIYKIIS